MLFLKEPAQRSDARHVDVGETQGNREDEEMEGIETEPQKDGFFWHCKGSPFA